MIKMKEIIQSKIFENNPLNISKITDMQEYARYLIKKTKNPDIAIFVIDEMIRIVGEGSTRRELMYVKDIISNDVYESNIKITSIHPLRFVKI